MSNFSKAPRYNEMTAAEREKTFWAERAAYEQLISGSSRLIMACKPDADRASRESRFIAQVARKCGDAWVPDWAIRNF
jgi:hypothetical protein